MSPNSQPIQTPRTDAAAIRTPAPVPFKGEFVRVEFAQQLERELIEQTAIARRETLAAQHYSQSGPDERLLIAARNTIAKNRHLCEATLLELFNAVEEIDAAPQVRTAQGSTREPAELASQPEAGAGVSVGETYAKAMNLARNEALEEAAAFCDLGISHLKTPGEIGNLCRGVLSDTAEAIRALKRSSATPGRQG